MRRSCHLVCLGSLGLTLVAGAATALEAQEPTFPARSVGVTAVALRQLFADYWRWHLAADPEDATRAGVHIFDDRWRDWSGAGRNAARERRQEFLRNFQYAGLGNLTNRERLNLALLERRLASALAAEDLILLSRLSPDGAHQDVFRVVAGMPAASATDYERLLSRLRTLSISVDQHIELWSELLARGLAQPASVVDRVAAQVEMQHAIAPGESPLLEAFRRSPASLSPAERARLEREATTAYLEQVLPAWERLGRFLRNEYRPRARASLGIATLPERSQQYAALLAYYGATTDSIALHEQAMADVARLEPQTSAAASTDRAGASATGPAAGLQDLLTMPEFRRHLRLPAFDDGWRVYKSRRVHEAAARAALDSGIHSRGWTRAQALAFASAHLGMADTGNVVDEVSALPGRALAVYAGARTFVRLRQDMASRLGDRFDEREFERVVLADGVLPLDLVELQAEEFVKTAVSSASRP